ncbi:galactose-binding domain-like protein [Irpex rosettiformis]|uniref:Galactose-binding domain-like protein n=1 Tax=Irpex rosettiformis TaxID=378272 RepID=A0ACB8UHX9_9APHY|nr:galactose-binding domain-like protein [Irpex rosettiformis]
MSSFQNSSPASQEESIASSLEGTDLTNLYASIDKANVHGLNLTVPEDAPAIFKPWHERNDTAVSANSAVDDQLIIHVPFTENVRMRSILLKLGRGESTPRHLRIYANYSNIVDFVEAEDATPHLNISLSEGEVGVVEYPLRASAFASIHSVSLFFSEAVGGESVQIFYVGFRGDSKAQRKEGTQKLEIGAANAPDARVIDRLTERSGGLQTTAR